MCMHVIKAETHVFWTWMVHKKLFVRNSSYSDSLRNTFKLGDNLRIALKKSIKTQFVVLNHRQSASGATKCQEDKSSRIWFPRLLTVVPIHIDQNEPMDIKKKKIYR